MDQDQHGPSLARRRFLRGSAAFAAAGLSGIAQAADQSAGSTPAEGKVEGVKALVFDVFGTVVDWRTGVARESRDILSPLGYTLDWLAFADAWRAEYQPAMEEVRSGRIPFSRLDVIHRSMLERIRPKFGLEKVPDPVLAELNLAWHRLDGWPDSSRGLHRLRKRFWLAPCSNGNISLMVDLARRNNFPWDAILGAEIAGDYKPKLRVYQVAAEAFGLKYEQVMMVAAHSNDLAAAAKAGLRTAHVTQLDEFGPNTGENGPQVPVDLAARSFEDLATKLGV